MTHSLVTRRQLLGTIVMAAAMPSVLASAQGLGGAASEGGRRFHSVAVDVSTLLDHGGGEPVRGFARVLLPQLRQVFADRLAPGDPRAPTLTARITNLYFADYADRTTSFAFGNNDNIEGDGVVSSGGRVLSSTHILTELPPSYSGAPLLAGIDEARSGAIAYQFAYWLRREMDL